MRIHHRGVVSAVIVGLTLAGGALGVLASVRQPADSVATSNTPNLQRIATSPGIPGIAEGVVEQATLRSQATFGSPGRTVRVYRGLALAGSPMAEGPGGADARLGRKSCAVVSGPGFTAATCRHDLFSDSNLLFMELGAGGPAKSDRTALRIAGLASPRVATIQAVDSTGATRTAQVKDGAFLVELPPDAVAAGIEISSIAAFSASGDLLESVNL